MSGTIVSLPLIRSIACGSSSQTKAEHNFDRIVMNSYVSLSYKKCFVNYYFESSQISGRKQHITKKIDEKV